MEDEMRKLAFVNICALNYQNKPQIVISTLALPMGNSDFEAKCGNDISARKRYKPRTATQICLSPKFMPCYPTMRP